MNDRIDKSAATLTRNDEVTHIPVSRLRVLNPRTRNPHQFARLVENISAIGLKRPITVAYGGSDDTGVWHEVLCGQGRLEALKALGEDLISCFVVEADQIERYLITLTENLARRRHTTEELMGGLQILRAKGYTMEQIARKTNLDPSYVSGVLHLLEHGEQRLLRAVENRVVSIKLAMDIARSSSDAVQAALLAAYEQGTLKGEQLMRVRKLITKRDAVGKAFYIRRPRSKDKPTPQKLLRTYQTEVRRQKMVVQNARIQEQRLLIVTSAVRKFLTDEHFRTLLRAEDILDIPEAVASRIPPELLP